MATKRYKRDLKELELRRRRGMRMLKRGVAQAAVARELGVSRQTVSRWNKALSAQAQPWRRKPLGRPGQLPAADKKKLVKLLLAGAVANGFATELWTLSRVALVIGREFGPAYSKVHVMRLLKELGFSCQKPEKRALQRDEAAIAEWKAKRWPALKKKPSEREEPLSSSTNPD